MKKNPFPYIFAGVVTAGLICLIIGVIVYFTVKGNAVVTVVSLFAIIAGAILSVIGLISLLISILTVILKKNKNQNIEKTNTKNID